MKIVCTVDEFAAMVKGCASLRGMYGCTKCPLCDVCNMGDERGVEKFITAENVIEDEGVYDGKESS